MRLIDKDAVDYENIMCSQNQLHWLAEIIERQPTIDAVPVVRCKDCEASGDCWDEFSDRCPPMTNADRIRAMCDEELADLLSHLAYTRDEPWSNLFALKFCHNCPEPEYTLDDGRKMNLHECDFKDGKCPHGSDVMWWLKQAAEEATK